MDGIQLILSAVCINASFCPNQQSSIDVNYNQFYPTDLYKTTQIISDDFKKLAAELKGDE